MFVGLINVFFWKVSVHVPCPLLNGFGWFLSCKFVLVLCRFWILALCQMGKLQFKSAAVELITAVFFPGALSGECGVLFISSCPSAIFFQRCPAQQGGSLVTVCQQMHCWAAVGSAQPLCEPPCCFVYKSIVRTASVMATVSVIADSLCNGRLPQ